MKFTLITQNVQGMNCSQKVSIVRNYYHALIPHVDVLCFQEHKLRGDKLITLKSSLWPKEGGSLLR